MPRRTVTRAGSRYMLSEQSRCQQCSESGCQQRPPAVTHRGHRTGPCAREPCRTPCVRARVPLLMPRACVTPDDDVYMRGECCQAQTCGYAPWPGRVFQGGTTECSGSEARTSRRPAPAGIRGSREEASGDPSQRDQGIQLRVSRSSCRTRLSGCQEHYRQELERRTTGRDRTQRELCARVARVRPCIMMRVPGTVCHTPSSLTAYFEHSMKLLCVACVTARCAHSRSKHRTARRATRTYHAVHQRKHSSCQ